jgi:hypothetical protein
MTQFSPTFNPQEFELRGYTNPWLNPEQQTSVSLVETRVGGQLDYLAQMLGWNGPNYWGNLPSSVSQKRQLLGGSFGVYNSFSIPRILEIRNWENTILIEPVPNLQNGQKVYLGEDEYEIQNAIREGDNYLISLGVLPESFYTQIAANVQLRVNIPTNRPSPFYRPSINVSGDNSFRVKASGSELTLFPGWDTSLSFDYIFPTIYSGSTYYFNQPIYLSYTSALTKDVLPKYDQVRERWALQVPATPAEFICFLVWEYADSTAPVPATLQLQVREWRDPSDWGSKTVLENFVGTWGNKGGPLPFNFAFDSLSIHGFNEFNSVLLAPVERVYNYNQLVNLVYSQLVPSDTTNPGQPGDGQLWWNTSTGALAVWYPENGACSPWVQINYRQQPEEYIPTVKYADVAAFAAGAPTLQTGVTVQIDNIVGLAISNNILGLQGTISTTGALTLFKGSSGPYWTPFEFQFADVNEFESNAEVLPYRVPVRILNANNLQTWDTNYRIPNLRIVIDGDYEVVLTKYQNNLTWELSQDSVMEFIANSNLVGTLKEGEMWWDFANPDPDARAASIYQSSYSAITALEIVNPGINLTDGTFTAVPLENQSVAGGADATADIVVTGGQVTSIVINDGGQMYRQGNVLVPDPVLYPDLTGCVFVVTACLADSWVSVNKEPIISVPNDFADISSLLVYCNGALLSNNRPYNTDHFIFTYSSDNTTGDFIFQLIPEDFIGQVQLPIIEISDSLTSAYRVDISNLVFSGLTYRMSPNVSGAETPLRLWKMDALQVIDTVPEIENGIYLNPLRADLNSGPGPENWQKYFVRMPLDYGRNDTEWQKTVLICQDFAYWGSSIEPEVMARPSELARPVIYEELVLLGGDVNDYTYVYTEPYLYSNLDFYSQPEYLTYREIFENTYDSPSVFSIYDNAGVFPTAELEFDEFTEANISEYEPLHNRIADVTSPIGAGFGNWIGEYVNINVCQELSGFIINDLLDGSVSPVAAPNWDASIYKYAPTDSFRNESYEVDSNNYKVGYAYFVADASVAEDTFFDIQEECSWRYPSTQPKTSYILPR